MDTDVGTENPDLAWELDEFINRERAMDFVMQFESTLCVYSPSVEQLYSTYNMYFPEDEARKLVILPDPGAFHDTFNKIFKSAVQRTGLYVVRVRAAADGQCLAGNRTIWDRAFRYANHLQCHLAMVVVRCVSVAWSD